MIQWNAVLKNPIVLAILFSSIFTYGQICSNVYYLVLIVETQYPLHLHDLTLQIQFAQKLLHRIGAASFFGAGTTGNNQEEIVMYGRSTTRQFLIEYYEGKMRDGEYDIWFGASGSGASNLGLGNIFMNYSFRRHKAMLGGGLISYYNDSQYEDYDFIKLLPKLSIIVNAAISREEKRYPHTSETAEKIELWQSKSVVKSITVGFKDEDFHWVSGFASPSDRPIPWPSDLPRPETVLSEDVLNAVSNHTNQFRIDTMEELLDFDIDALLTPDLATCVVLGDSMPYIHIENKPINMTIKAAGLLAVITLAKKSGMSIELDDPTNTYSSLRCLFSYADGAQLSTPATIIDLTHFRCEQPGGAKGEATVDLEWQLIRSMVTSSVHRRGFDLSEDGDSVVRLTTGKPHVFSVVEMQKDLYPQNIGLAEMLAFVLLILIIIEFRMCCCAGLSACCCCGARRGKV